MNDHPSFDQLKQFLGHQLPPPESSTIEDHVNQCRLCQQELARLEATSAVVDWGRLQPLPRAEPRLEDPERLARFLQRLQNDPPPEVQQPVPAVPGYEVLGEAGRGGMGVVFKARHLALNRVVALKMVLAGPYASAAEKERFLHEAQAVARLSHPNIVQVHELGEHAGYPFFSLEWMPGGSLAQLLGGTPLPPRQAAELLGVVAGAVQHAHMQGIVHRDLKPGNVLLAGYPKARSPRSPTSASPGSSTCPASRRAPGRCWARPATWPPSRRADSRPALRRTCTLWGRSCTSASPAGLPSRPPTPWTRSPRC
jgi:serine/threonine protein kinase